MRPGRTAPIGCRRRSSTASGLAKATFATALLLALFATGLAHVTGVLLVAGYLLISRRLATRTMLGLVDWHLLVLFCGLFVVTHALDTTGLPDGRCSGSSVRGFIPSGSWCWRP